MSPWYGFWRRIVQVYFRFSHKIDYYHASRVPKTGGFILAANHMSYLDPPLIGCASPRELYYMARKTLFRFWWSNWVLASVNVVPVDLQGSSLAAFKAVIRLLEDGKPVLIFPEGTRSVDGRLGEPEAGIGWLALKSGVPVVPARVWGTDVAMPKQGKGRRAHLEVKFGKPLNFDAGALPKDRRQASEAVARRVMEAIAALEPHQDVDKE